jgi:hypothetical protein
LGIALLFVLIIAYAPGENNQKSADHESKKIPWEGPLRQFMAPTAARLKG